MTELTHMPTEIPVSITDDRRLLVETWENAAGVKLVTVIPQYLDRLREWRLSHSGLMLTAQVARELAPAILALAATIEDSPQDPAPTPESRDESRWP